jgi:hypothetical protein
MWPVDGAPSAVQMPSLATATASEGDEGVFPCLFRWHSATSAGTSLITVQLGSLCLLLSAHSCHKYAHCGHVMCI